MARKWIKCVIEGCKKRNKTYDSLFGHLYYAHRKADLIKALFKALGFPDVYPSENPLEYEED